MGGSDDNDLICKQYSKAHDHTNDQDDLTVNALAGCFDKDKISSNSVLRSTASVRYRAEIETELHPPPPLVIIVIAARKEEIQGMSVS